MVTAASLVGLDRTLYNVSEQMGMVEVCAIIYSPVIDCPIAFPFDVRLSSTNGSAGKERVKLQSYHNFIIKIVCSVSCGL